MKMEKLLIVLLLVGTSYGFVFHSNNPHLVEKFEKVLEHKKPTFDTFSVKEVKFDTGYFTQILDHFNFKSHNQTEYQQRYLINIDFWKAKRNGPIFFYTGNEGDIESFKDASGFLSSFGSEVNAMIVFAEHRYYGKSLPFGEASFDGDNIGLLTMEQAMADFAKLIIYLRQKYKVGGDVKLITFGGSYGGQLAAYMRMRYPNLVDGALSASAPLYWITDSGDRHGFWKSVTSTFSSHPGCHEAVTQGFDQVQKMADAGRFEKLRAEFNICERLDASNLRHLLEWSRNAFTDLAMMNYPYPTNFLAPLPGHPVREACWRATNATSKLSALSAITSLYYASSDGCNKMMEQYVKCSDPTGCGLGNDAKAWDFQACTEIILPGGTLGGEDDMFPVLSFTDQERAKYCQQKYQVEPRLDWIRTAFWTDDLDKASRIIFSNGDLDPWGPGGVNATLSDDLPFVEVTGGAHHFDLRGPNDQDPEAVIAAREKEKTFIKSWIGL